MAGFDRIAAIAGLVCAVVVFGVAQLWRPPALVLEQLGGAEERYPRAETPRIVLSAHPVRAGEPFADPTKIAAALDMPGGGFQVETDAGGAGYLVATDRRALERLAAEAGAGRDVILAVGPLEKAGIVRWRGFVLDKTAVVAPGDVEEARLIPAPPHGEASVSVGLSAAGRERALAYGGTHAGTPVALVMDGVVARVATTKELVPDGRITIAPMIGFEDATRIAARLGGAAQPTPMWVLQTARLVPALLVGFLVMSVFVIARRQR